MCGEAVTDPLGPGANRRARCAPSGFFFEISVSAVFVNFYLAASLKFLKYRSFACSSCWDRASRAVFASGGALRAHRSHFARCRMLLPKFNRSAESFLQDFLGFFLVPFTATFYARARPSPSTQLALPCQGLGTGQTPRCPSVACLAQQASRAGHDHGQHHTGPPFRLSNRDELSAGLPRGHHRGPQPKPTRSIIPGI
jgi:hypothetical protein